MKCRHVDLPLIDCVSQTYGPARAVAAIFDGGVELQYVDRAPRPGEWSIVDGAVRLGGNPVFRITALAADQHLAPRTLDASDVAGCVGKDHLDHLNSLAAA